MSDRSRIATVEAASSENKAGIAELTGILKNGLCARVANIEKRQWALLTGTALMLIGTVVNLFILLTRMKT